MIGSRTLTIGLTGAICLSALAALAGPGNGIKAGPMVIHPYADAAVSHDSNVGRVPSDRQSDTFFDGLAGVQLQYSALNLDFDAKGYGGVRRYADVTDLDFSHWGQAMQLRWGAREQVEMNLSQSYRRVEDLDTLTPEYAVGGISSDSILDVSARNERDIFQASLSVGRELSDKVEIDLGARYDSLDYDSTALRDVQGFSGLLETAYGMTPKTALFLAAQFAAQNGSGNNDSANAYAGRIGIKTHGTDKLDFKAGVGMQHFEPDTGEDKTAVSYHANVVWTATEKVSLLAGGRNGISKSILADNEGVHFSTVRLGIISRMSSEVNVSLSGAWRLDDYLDTTREDNGIGARARIDYVAPSGFFGIYGQLEHEDVDSNINNNDYKALRTSLGMRVRY